MYLTNTCNFTFIQYPREFNDLVNMSASELKDWLGSADSAGAGWDKDDGSGESIGHER